MTKKILFEDALILSAARTARFLVHVLPLRVSLAIGRGIGAVLYFFTKRRRIAYQNIRSAFSQEKTRAEMKQIARRSIQNLVMSVVELLRFPDLDKAYLEQHVKIIGTEKFKPFLERGQGIIFLTAHFGNWELLNIASSLLEYPMVALARNQKHPRSDEFLNSLRTSKGGQVIKKGMPIREVLKSLKKGKIVGMLSDQDGGRNGVFVRFFNRLSSTPSGAATFALRTGAPIFPVVIFRNREVYHRVEVEGPLRVSSLGLTLDEAERDLLQQFAEILESKIRKSPDQWLWAHRRWKSTPNRSVIVLNDGKAGHLNQSLAVVEAMKEERKNRGLSPERVHTSVIDVKFRDKFSENFLKIFCITFQGHIPFKVWILKQVLTKECYDALMRTYADVVVSCGASLLGVNLFVKHENHAKSVVVMKPPFSTRRFESVVVPKHDRTKPAPNVFVTEMTPSLITPKYLEVEANKLSKDLALSKNGPWIGFLVGGDTATMKFSREPFEKLLEALERYSHESNALLLATSSRRTPAWADELLKRFFGDHKHCPLLVIPNESSRAGAVGGILGLSDIVVVSGESMSMVSEAVHSGKPVIVFMPSNEGKLKPKHRRFLDRMREQKLIWLTSPETMGEAIRNHMAPVNGDGYRWVQKDREVLNEAVKRVA